MATKNVAEVVIAGKILKITGYESMEYLHQIASYINEKIGEFEQLEGYRRHSNDQKHIMVYMNLADDYFKSKYQAEQQKASLDKNEKEMYSLKHDLIECQMAKENLEQAALEESSRFEKQLEELRAQNQELQAQLQLVKRQLEEAKQNKNRYNKSANNRNNPAD